MGFSFSGLFHFMSIGWQIQRYVCTGGLTNEKSARLGVFCVLHASIF